MARRYTIEVGGGTFTIDVEESDVDRFEVSVEGQTYEVRLAGDEDLPEAKITPAFEPAGGARPTVTVVARPAASSSASAAVPRPAPARRRPAGPSNATLPAPMPGVILEVMVKAGDKVVRGQEIAVLEAMKMQNTIRSPRDGTIGEVCVTAGEAIGHGDAIVRFAEGA